MERPRPQLVPLLMAVFELWQVAAPHFCAGVIVGADGIIKRAAPILRYVEGKRLQWLKTYCQHKRWEINSVCIYVVDC